MRLKGTRREEEDLLGVGRSTLGSNDRLLPHACVYPRCHDHAACVVEVLVE
jgi:hypothetical protein